ncbi:TetR/AcrR family transcriptional regulator, partial [Mesorhizobium sp. M2A.F.Ca.ET.037.01.1.1]
MAIRARDGADRAELAAVAEIALSGWDHITTTIGHGIQRKA